MTDAKVPTEQETALLDQARNEAQARVAEVHVEKGTVKSEEGHNSPHPDDHDQPPDFARAA